MGLGRFSGMDWFNSCSNSENGSTPNHHIHHHHINIGLLTTSSSCVSENQQSLPDWESCVSSLVCLPWVCYCASLPDEVCQHARGSSRCPESPDIVPLCQMVAVPVHKDCTHGSVYLFMMILFVLLSHVMAYWLCLSPFYCFIFYV